MPAERSSWPLKTITSGVARRPPLLGRACCNQGDLDAAHGRYTEALPSLQKAGHLSDALGLSLALADILIAQGRLGEAMGTYRRGLKVAAGQAPLVLRGAADMHVGMSELLREHNDLDAAQQHLQTSTELGEHAGLPQNAYRSRVALGRRRPRPKKNIGRGAPSRSSCCRRSTTTHEATCPLRWRRWNRR